MFDTSTYDDGLQVLTDENGEIVYLRDERYSWREKKLGTIELAKLYRAAGYPAYSERAVTCATWLDYAVSGDGKKRLRGANFCQLRLCPMCIGRRKKKAELRVSRVLDAAFAASCCRFIFLTLTVRNVSGAQLGDTYLLLTKAWDRLCKQRPVKTALVGWFRAIETTCRGQGYHPHIHAILAVKPDYFQGGGGYIPHQEWVRRWKLALGVDYDPSVRIQVTRSKGEYAASVAAAQEAAKYAVKDDEYISRKIPWDEKVRRVRDYTEALHRRRLVAFGGLLRQIAHNLNLENLEDGDLVHVDDEEIRDDIVELVEVYHWHFGAGDYILTDRLQVSCK